MTLAEWFLTIGIACAVVGGLLLLRQLILAPRNQRQTERLYWREEINSTIELSYEDMIVFNDQEYLRECIDNYRNC